MNNTQLELGRICLWGDLTTKSFLDYLLIRTLSDNQEVVKWANKSLQEYARIKIKQMQNDVPGNIVKEYLEYVESHFAIYGGNN
jgi:hypothetical protein